MPEHAHMLVCPRQTVYDISDTLGAIKEPVGRRAIAYLKKNAPNWLPRVTRKRGKRTERLFWQSGGGYDQNIHQVGPLEAIIEYFHNNPVRRGLVERTVDWYWSSARWYAFKEMGPLTIDPIPS